MEDDNENDARGAAQGLLEIAIKASRKSVDSRTGKAEQIRTQTHQGGENVKPPEAPSKTLMPTLPSPGGRIITSGDYASHVRPREDINPAKSPETRKKGEFQQPKPKKLPQQERVTVIINRSSEGQNDGAQNQEDKGMSPNPRRGPPPIGSDPKPLADAQPLTVPSSSIDLPIPPSAFASLIGSGDSGKSSADFTPIVGKVTPIGADRTRDETDEETESDSEDKENGHPAHKRQKIARTVSINTVLNRVGDKEHPLSDIPGTAPQTVQEIVGLPLERDSQKSAFTATGILDVGNKRKLSESIGPKGPFLPQRNSSDQSTIDLHKHLAEQASEEYARMNSHQSGISLRHSGSADLHQGFDQASAQPGNLLRENPDQSITTERQANLGPLIGTSLSPVDIPKESDEESRTVLWSGSVKHRLRTNSGASVVELFNLNALVPARLIEQMPPTLFVNGIVGRQNVKLGKHYVAQCRLGNLTEKQLAKVNSLATMKMVAICELQHCTVTIVPHHSSDQELRMTAFMIADE